jgi:hypothetical protein
MKRQDLEEWLRARRESPRKPPMLSPPDTSPSSRGELQSRTSIVPASATQDSLEFSAATEATFQELRSQWDAAPEFISAWIRAPLAVQQRFIDEVLRPGSVLIRANGGRQM